MAKILIVEDSTFFRQLLKETLLFRYPKMDISEAPNAEEALKKVNILSPDLIFVDIRLPGESGLDFTRKIKSTYPNIPVIILTSYDLPEYREAAKEYQADHFLSKGTTTKENILALVRSILSKPNHGPDGHNSGHPL
jgi:DNA-binding NarL/FixJ family response regulator